MYQPLYNAASPFVGSFCKSGSVICLFVLDRKYQCENLSANISCWVGRRALRKADD